MAKIIIGIHGLANKPEEETLETYWQKAISEGLEHEGVEDPAFEFRLVYWADYLYRYPMHQDRGYCFDRLYNHEPYIRATAIREYKDGWKDELRGMVGKTFGPGLDWFKNKFGIDRLADAVLAAKLKDLDYYYQETPVRTRTGGQESAKRVLRREMAEALTEMSGHEIFLIAHSMGTIIAYDVLRVLGNEGPRVPVKHLVTIGSPLGLPHVKQKIIEEREAEGRPEAAELRTPTLVTGSWINYADKSDPVALDSHLRDDFGPNRDGIQVRDDLVSNDYVGSSGEPNAHKSYGYLRTPELSRQLKAFLY